VKGMPRTTVHSTISSQRVFMTCLLHLREPSLPSPPPA
jgi:hypothetical protein